MKAQRKTSLTLVLTGIHLMLLNFILVQQLSFAIRKPFFAVIVYTLSFFLSISLGYFFSDRLTHKSKLWIIPVMLAIQFSFFTFLQPIAYLFKETFGEVGMYVVLTIILMGFSAVLGASLLPAMVKEHNLPLFQAYRLEIVGSILGLLLVFILGKMIGYDAIVFTYLGTWILLSICLNAPRLLILFVGLLVSLFCVSFISLDKVSAGWFYQRYYKNKKIEKVIYRKHSVYQKIEVAETRSQGKILLLNGRRQFAGSSHENYSYFVAELPAKLMEKPEVAVLGCGSMSTVGRIGEHAEHFTIVDLDEEVFKASSRFFTEYNRIDQLNNWSFTPDDAKHYLGNASETFDLILHDIPPARSRQNALTYTREFFTLVREHLKAQGIFSIASLTPLKGNSDYAQNMLATLSSVFENYFAIEYKGDFYFYGGRETLEVPSRALLRERLAKQGKEDAKIFFKKEMDQYRKKGKVVTVNNLGDLIFE